MRRLWTKKKNEVGKRVGRDLYVHKDYIDLMPSHEKAIALEAIARLNAPASGWSTYRWNIIKICGGKSGASFLNYPGFYSSPHPRLFSSVRINEIGLATHRMGGGSILHRKELMVGPDHPGRDMWVDLTKDEEDAGLFDKVHLNHIGRETYWDALLAAKGLTITGHTLMTVSGTPWRMIR